MNHFKKLQHNGNIFKQHYLKKNKKKKPFNFIFIIILRITIHFSRNGNNVLHVIFFTLKIKPKRKYGVLQDKRKTKKKGT